jgi:hypothetical protein
MMNHLPSQIKIRNRHRLKTWKLHLIFFLKNVNSDPTYMVLYGFFFLTKIATTLVRTQHFNDVLLMAYHPATVSDVKNMG